MFEKQCLWQPSLHYHRHSLSDALRAWLLNPYSLTAHMEQACTTVKVDVISHKMTLPTREEAPLLNIPPRTYASIREIYMFCDNKPWLFARAVIPISTMRGKWRRLRGFGSLPLGKLLFTDPNVERGPFDICQLSVGQCLYEKAIEKVSKKADFLWARRSLFDVDNKPLLLTEVFLPDMLEHIC